MAFMKSKVNGLIIQIPDRLAMAKLPMAFTTEQNGHLFERDPVTATPLVQVSDTFPVSEFKGEAAPKAIEALVKRPEETRVKASRQRAKTEAKTKVEIPEEL